MELTDKVALVTLIDRERRNAMTAAMVGEIVATFDALESDDDVGAVVITGEPPAFCSGADVAALGSYRWPVSLKKAWPAPGKVTTSWVRPASTSAAVAASRLALTRSSCSA